MNKVISARKLVIRQMGHEIKNSPWISPLPKTPLAMIVITYAVIDWAGDRLWCSTWAIGSTARVAIGKWLNARPTPPAADDYSYTVVTEKKFIPYEYQRPLGKRAAPVTDTIKEYIQATG